MSTGTSNGNAPVPNPRQRLLQVSEVSWVFGTAGQGTCLYNGTDMEEQRSVLEVILKPGSRHKHEHRCPIKRLGFGFFPLMTYNHFRK